MRLAWPDSTLTAVGFSRCRALACMVLLFGIGVSNTARSADELNTKTLEEKWSSAISNDRTDLLESMLGAYVKEQSDPLELLQTDAPNGKSALMVAAKQGDLVLVKHMVKLGASINEVTLTGGTPFMFAVLGNHVEVAKWLETKGADINAKGSNGWSAATIAGAKGQADMLRWLIDAGADINAPDVYRFTPLMRAVDNQHVESVQVLLTMGGANVDFKDESGNSALHFAAANKLRLVVQMLLAHGADPMHANRDGITPNDVAKQHPTLIDLFTGK